MTVPNPAPHPGSPRGPQHPVANPAAVHAAFPPAPAQHLLATPGDPYAGRPGSEAPFAPPVHDAEPPAPPRPRLSKAAAHRARLAGGVGGGIAWLGLGIAQLCLTLLLLPVLVGGLVFGVGLAFAAGGGSPTAGAWSQVLDWLGSPWGVALAIGIPGGIVVALLGLWLSTRMLRHPGLRRPVAVTWAGFGIAAGAAILLSGLGSLSLPFFGGTPLGDAFDPRGFDPGSTPGAGPGPLDEADVDDWLAQGGAEMLQQLVDPSTLLGMLGPWLVLGQLIALVVPIAASVFTWWWMAHAMRPGADAASDGEAGGVAVV